MWRTSVTQLDFWEQQRSGVEVIMVANMVVKIMVIIVMMIIMVKRQWSWWSRKYILRWFSSQKCAWDQMSCWDPVGKVSTINVVVFSFKHKTFKFYRCPLTLFWTRRDVQNISPLPSDHFLVSFSGLRLKCFLREQIAHWMETTLDEATDPWGVKVERVEMWDHHHP